MYRFEVKPDKKLGATAWMLYKDGQPFLKGLTREQAEQIKQRKERKEEDDKEQ